MSTILIADDQADLVSILASRFRALGHRVLEAHDGARAFEIAQRDIPDLVILDVMMPELNGYQVCRQLKQDRGLAAVPVVLLTAKGTEADRFWGGEVGADLYLMKPIDPAEVVKQVQGLLEGR